MSFDYSFPNAEQMDKLIAAVNACAAGSVQDADVLDELFAVSLNTTNTSEVFARWYPYAKALAGAGYDRYELLQRFFKMLAGSCDNLVFTLRGYKATVSTATPLTPLDDLAGFSAAQLCTESTTPVKDWADEHPMGGWYIRFNALSLADGSMNVLAIEGVDNAFDLTGELAPLYAGCMAMYRREYENGDYRYKSFRSTPDGAGLFEDPEENLNPDLTHRYMIWHPVTAGCLNGSGGLTSGFGKKPALFTSEQDGLTKARITGAYEGLMTDCDSRWGLDMWQLRHFDKENSNIAEGCTNYNLTYTCAVAETDVKRVILSTANAANLIVGSSVWIGDRNSSSPYAEILSKEEVSIGGTTYVAVNLDLASNISPTTSTKINTAPWKTGKTEALPGHKDGCLNSLTAGKGPLRVMGVEFLTGCWDVGADPLYTVTANASSGYNYVVSTVRDATKQANSVTANYEATGITLTGITGGWHYVREFVISAIGMLFPSLLDGGTDSSKYYKSAFSGSVSAGVRVPWRRGGLNHAGNAGLACESANRDPAGSGWDEAPRLGGSGKTRGKQAA